MQAANGTGMGLDRQPNCWLSSGLYWSALILDIESLAACTKPLDAHLVVEVMHIALLLYAGLQVHLFGK